MGIVCFKERNNKSQGMLKIVLSRKTQKFITGR